MKVNSPWPVHYKVPPMKHRKCSRDENHSTTGCSTAQEVCLPEFPLKFWSHTMLLSNTSQLLWTKMMLHGMGAVFKHCQGYVLTAHGFCNQKSMMRGI